MLTPNDHFPANRPAPREADLDRLFSLEMRNILAAAVAGSNVKTFAKVWREKT